MVFNKIAFFILNKYYWIKTGKKMRVHGLFEVGNWRNLNVGNDVVFNKGVYIQARGCIDIKNSVVISRNVSIFDASYNKNHSGSHEIKKVVIGEGTWIGANSIILPGVVIGKNVVIAAGSVVTKSCDDNVVLGGNPAKVIKLK